MDWVGGSVTVMGVVVAILTTVVILAIGGDVTIVGRLGPWAPWAVEVFILV